MIFTLQHNTEWRVSACETCYCEDGITICTNTSCDENTECNPGEVSQVLPSHCCPVCVPAGRKYPEKGHISIAGRGGGGRIGQINYFTYYLDNFIFLFTLYLKQNMYFSLCVEIIIYFTFLENSGKPTILENSDIEIWTKLDPKVGLVLTCRKPFKPFLKTIKWCFRLAHIIIYFKLILELNIYSQHVFQAIIYLTIIECENI